MANKDTAARLAAQEKTDHQLAAELATKRMHELQEAAHSPDSPLRKNLPEDHHKVLQIAELEILDATEQSVQLFSMFQKVTTSIIQRHNELKESVNGLSRELTEAQSRIARLETAKDGAEKSSFRKSTWLRLIFSLLLLVLGEGSVLYLALRFAEGVNSFQRLQNSTVWFVGVFAGWLFLTAVILGKERRHGLRWPINKLFEKFD